MQRRHSKLLYLDGRTRSSMPLGDLKGSSKACHATTKSREQGTRPCRTLPLHGRWLQTAEAGRTELIHICQRAVSCRLKPYELQATFLRRPCGQKAGKCALICPQREFMLHGSDVCDLGLSINLFAPKSRAFLAKSTQKKDLWCTWCIHGALCAEKQRGACLQTSCFIISGFM